MKKMFFLLCFGGILLGSCQSTKEQPTVERQNPFVTCESLQQAYQLACFTMTAPEVIDDTYNTRIIRAINGSVIEVIYPNAKDSRDEIRLRKGFALDDVSGDYHTYAITKQASAAGKAVLLRGETNAYHVASWKDGRYAYAVIARKGLSEKMILSLATALR